MSLGSGVVDHQVFAGSPDARQRSFEPSHDGLVSGRLSGTTARRLRQPVPVFPVPFGVPALACCAIPSPLRTSAPLTVGLPEHTPWTSTGLPRSAGMRRDRGGPLLYPGDGGVLPTGRGSPIGACRFSAASPAPSLPPPVCEGDLDETSTEIHTINPSDLSLARSSQTEQEPFSVYPGLRTPPLPATHARAGTGLTDTDPELDLQHSRTSTWLAHSPPATSCRTPRLTPGVVAACNNDEEQDKVQHPQHNQDKQPCTATSAAHTHPTPPGDTPTPTTSWT